MLRGFHFPKLHFFMRFRRHTYQRFRLVSSNSCSGVLVMSDDSDPDGDDLSDPDKEEMRQFFSLYGSFLQLWQTFEVEIAIMRQLNLSARHASIVLCSLNFAAKSNVLSALLSEDAVKNHEALLALGNAQSKAGRNNLIHSFLTISDIGASPMRLVRRDVKNGNYNADLKDVSVSTMSTHGFQFVEAFERFQDAIGVTGADVHEYIAEIESHA